MILLWGLPTDGPLAAVRARLDDMDADVRLLDQRDVLRTTVDLVVGPEPVAGVVSVDGDVFDLADVDAAYLRPDDSRRLPSVAAAAPAHRAAAEAAEQALWTWAELAPAFVLNRPGAMAANGSKPYQAARIAARFAVPETVVTSDADALRAFAAAYEGELVFKSTSGVRSIVTELAGEHWDRLEDLGTCPVQFQRRVPGEDVRVHVVGDRVFACAIRASSADYRYADDAELAATELPDDVARGCVGLSRDLDLPLAGIDLRRDPDGCWWCFEVNPSPAFTYYDRFGQDIAGAVAALLCAGEA